MNVANFVLEEQKNWRTWVTPKTLRDKPIHRWYVFPHSYTSELVHALIDEWGLTTDDNILDPFSGAGTTLLAAKEKGIPATGYDLSPLAVLSARVKVANYDLENLKKLWSCLQRQINPARWNGASRNYPELVSKALPGKLIGAFDAMDRSIGGLKTSQSERDFFKLALLATIPKYSRAIATGGWLKWIDRRKTTTTLPSAISEQIELMLKDLSAASPISEPLWRVELADARSLPDDAATYTSVITSPPYPNRHDYTRVFGVELMFGFLDWEQTRQLRYQSFHSHPESHPVRPNTKKYSQPTRLDRILSRIRKNGGQQRIIEMLEGYFHDMFLVLHEVRRVCKRKARIAFVVGNAQYNGVPIPVDELTAEAGEQAGLICEKLIAARFRGNSAQQMGKYGRKPSRESVVVFKKP